jgi:hypothetical protein
MADTDIGAVRKQKKTEDVLLLCVSVIFFNVLHV